MLKSVVIHCLQLMKNGHQLHIDFKHILKENKFSSLSLTN